MSSIDFGSFVQFRRNQPHWIKSNLGEAVNNLIDADVVGQAQNAVADIRFIVEQISELAITALLAADTFIKATVNPAITALILALRQLRDLFQGLLDTGVFMTMIEPTPARLVSAEDCLRLLASSLTDDRDKNRPITVSGAVEEVCMFSLVARLPDLRLFDRLMDAINELLKLPEFPRYRAALDRLQRERVKPSPGKGKGAYPDWNAGRLIDIVPALGEALKDIIETINLLIELVSAQFALMEDLIKAIEQKVLAITRILNIIEQILNTIELILSANFLTGLFIWGTYSPESLAEEIRASIATIPGYTTTDFIPNNPDAILPDEGRYAKREVNGSPPNIGFIVSFCAVGPNSDTLAYLFGQGERIVDGIQQTAEGF